MTYADRIQEWLADRVSWVQYPQIRRSAIKRHLFLNQMPGPLRAGLVLYGVAALAACAIALFFLGLLFWAIFTA